MAAATITPSIGTARPSARHRHGRAGRIGRRVAAGLFAALITIAGTSACNATAQTCVNGTCKVSVTGEGTVHLDQLDSDVRVGPIEASAAAVTVNGQTARLTPGQTASVGGLSVQLASVDGRTVQLVVTGG